MASIGARRSSWSSTPDSLPSAHAFKPSVQLFPLTGTRDGEYGGRRQRRYARDAAVGLALLLGLVVGALAARSGRADTVRAGSSPVIVRYVGPHGALARDARLRATATSPGARIVAVTFLLDGRPLGSV